MSYPKKLLRLRPTKGVALDVPAWEVGPDYYTGGSHVLFRDGTAQRTKGERAVYATVQDDVLNLINARSGSTNYWLYHGTDKSYVVDSTPTHSEVTHASGLTAVDDASQWTSTLLNGVVCSTNSLDAPMYWNGNPASAMVTLPDWPAGSSCKSLAAFKYHLFALDLSESGGEYPMKVQWSDATDPGTVPASWTAAASNEAGSAELSDTPGPVMCAVPLRGTLLVYKTSSLYACDYVENSDAVFEFRLLSSQLGALTRHSVVDIGGQHCVLTDHDIVLTDGTNRKSIGTGRVTEYLFDTIDTDNYHIAFVAYNRSKNEVWVCYPTTAGASGFCDEALIYDIDTDSWSAPRPLSAVSCGAVGIVNDSAPSGVWADASYTWAEATQKWGAQNYSYGSEQLVLGEPSVPQFTLIETADLTTRAATLERHGLTFGDPERLKFVKRLHIRKRTTPGTLYVRVGTQMDSEDSITWGSEITLAAGDSIVDVPSGGAMGRFISAEVRSEDTQAWIITGIDLEAELRGYF